MSIRSVVGLAAFAAVVGLAQPAAAQTARYCNNRLTGSDMSFVSRPGGGYGVMFIDYSMRLKNDTGSSVTATITVGGGLGARFIVASANTQQLGPNASITVRVGTFSGTAGSQPPSFADILNQVRVTC